MNQMELRNHPFGGYPRGPACQAAMDFGIDLGELDYLIGLTPLERLVRHDQALELVLAARKAGAQYYGVDARLAEDPGRS